MMRNKLFKALAFVAIVLFVGLALWLFSAFWATYREADASVQAAIIAGAVAFITGLLAYWRERSVAIREAHRDKKIEVYSKFYDVMFSIMEQSRSSSKKDLSQDKKFQDNWMAISRGVLFYGSPQVVSAFTEFKSEGNVSDPLDILRRVGRILLAMRSDIGLSNWGLSELSVHQIYVKDNLSEKIGMSA